MIDWLKRTFIPRLSAESVEPPCADTPSAASHPQPKPVDVTRLLAEGCEQLKRGDSVKAVDCFQELLSIDPRNATAHNHLTVALGNLGRFQEADVPYEELIVDQEGWTRRIVDFIGLPWDERCLSFHATERAVFTASTWQVRQKLYKSSVGRWRNYEKFIGPLLELKGLD